eukprot:scaffold23487_cov104-Cylindrotheca_fusiformis.AAC.1
MPAFSYEERGIRSFFDPLDTWCTQFALQFHLLESSKRHKQKEFRLLLTGPATKKIPTKFAATKKQQHDRVCVIFIVPNMNIFCSNLSSPSKKADAMTLLRTFSNRSGGLIVPLDEPPPTDEAMKSVKSDNPENDHLVGLLKPSRLQRQHPGNRVGRRVPTPHRRSSLPQQQQRMIIPQSARTVRTNSTTTTQNQQQTDRILSSVSGILAHAGSPTRSRTQNLPSNSQIQLVANAIEEHQLPRFETASNKNNTLMQDSCRLMARMTRDSSHEPIDSTTPWSKNSTTTSSTKSTLQSSLVQNSQVFSEVEDDFAHNLCHQNHQILKTNHVNPKKLRRTPTMASLHHYQLQHHQQPHQQQSPPQGQSMLLRQHTDPMMMATPAPPRRSRAIAIKQPNNGHFSFIQFETENDDDDDEDCSLESIQ